ncbi:MAG: hypothetical protein FWE68_01805 [Defluviitaleaceae bacterium]|nr:hypothetical protein [Defluviitaleaceae bacterium]
MDKFLASILIAALALLTCFSFGVFDGDGVSKVQGKEYTGLTFSGDLKDGRFTGYGTIDFHDGDMYYGNFSEGRFDGDGTLHGVDNADGWRFNGAFEGGRVNSGTLQISLIEIVSFERGEAADYLNAQNWRFEGNFNQRGQNGEGAFVFADGSVYTGGFTQGLADGEGTYADASGRIIYTGGFAGGLFDGQGHYFSSEGWSYEGGFKVGLFDGEGIMTIEDEAVRGVWEKGVQTARYDED